MCSTPTAQAPDGRTPVLEIFTNLGPVQEPDTFTNLGPVQGRKRPTRAMVLP